MNNYSRFLEGLVAAPHTPMRPDGSLYLALIEKQAARLITDRVAGAFVCGTTGEGASMTTDERQSVAQTWRKAIGERPLKLIVHVGHNSLPEARMLARHAVEIGADAISALAPSYFKPASTDDLVDFCAKIAAAAPSLPFYFYDIPSMTGVSVNIGEFLATGRERIPNLAGVKYTNSNLMGLQECLHADGGRYSVLFGSDEMLLGALAMGVRGAVGSTYNYAAPLYYELMAAFHAGDWDTARALQWKSVKLVQALQAYGVLASGKALMTLVGIDCGPTRPPIRPLTKTQMEELFGMVERAGMFKEKAKVN